jgi:hypothetical protein
MQGLRRHFPRVSRRKPFAFVSLPASLLLRQHSETPVVSESYLYDQPKYRTIILLPQG